MTSFRQLLNALDEPALEIDLAGEIIFATVCARSLLGMAEGANLIKAVSSWCRPRFEHAVGRIRDGNTAMAAIKISFGEDRASAIAVEAKLAGDAHGSATTTSIAVWLHDVSTENAHEAAANVQSTHLLDLVETIAEGCVVERGDGSIEMLNAAFCLLFGVKAAPQSLVGTSCSTLFQEAARTNGDGPHYPALDHTEPDTFEFPHRDNRVMVQHIHPVAGKNSIAGRLHVFRLKRKNESVSVRGGPITAAQMLLMERIADDLAIAVDGTSRAIRRTEQLDLPVSVGHQFQQIAKATTSALSAVSDLLDFSRIETGVVVPDASEFRLRDVIAAMLDRFAPLAEARQVQIKVRVEQDVPEHLVGDSARLTLCLRSLLESALPTSDEAGELELSIEPEYATEGVVHVRFKVEHACPKGVTRSKGLSSASNMHLALARQTVRALGSENANAKIDMRERKEALDFQFTATLPYQKKQVIVTRPTYISLTGLPLLIVSHDPKERHMLAQNCREWRLLPYEADNAEMALHLLESASQEGNPIPLVITSNELPIQDGFLLAFRIKHHPALRATAVMMLAKTGKMGDAMACRENGIHAYLRHPIASVQLNEAISAVLLNANDDPEATPTLVTRHSLREAKSGAVLLIDAEREQSLLASQVLRRADYRVVVAEFADDAYAALDLELFDVIIVDSNAPGFTTRTSPATQIKRRLEKITRSATVLLAMDPNKTARIMDFDGSLLKPYDKDKLPSIVAKYVQPKKSEPERLG